MPKIFKYKGRNSSGHMVTGNMRAGTINDVVLQLEKQSITPIDIKPAKSGSFDWRTVLSKELTKPKPKIQDIMNFCRQLAALTGAGISLVKAIDQLAQSSRSPSFKKTLTTISTDIAAGIKLGDALRKHPESFSTIIVNTIDIGESTGHLHEALAQLGNYLESTITNRRSFISTIRYPLFVLTTIFGSAIFITTFVIPKFMTIFKQFNAKLPWASVMLIKTSNFITGYWEIMLATIVVISLSIYKLLKIPRYRYLWDKKKLSLPFIGSILHRILLSQFAWTFSLVLRSGVPIVQGLILTSDSTGNFYFKKELLNIGKDIEHGELFSKAAARTNIFTPAVLQMIEIGEESGRMDELIAEAAKYYDSEIAYDMRRLNETIEPVILTILAIMVFILALGAYGPMWELISSIKNKF